MNQHVTKAWWCIPVIIALGRQSQKHHEFQASLGYIVKPCLKQQRKRRRRRQRRKEEKEQGEGKRKTSRKGRKEKGKKRKGGEEEEEGKGRREGREIITCKYQKGYSSLLVTKEMPMKPTTAHYGPA
jgi:hypothetical protein